MEDNNHPRMFKAECPYVGKDGKPGPWNKPKNKIHKGMCKYSWHNNNEGEK